jgi:hypothetical protein
LRHSIDGDLLNIGQAAPLGGQLQKAFDDVNTNNESRDQLPASLLVTRLAFTDRYAGNVLYRRAAGLFVDSSQVRRQLLRHFRFEYVDVDFIPNGPAHDNIAGDRLRAQGPLLYSRLMPRVPACDVVVRAVVDALNRSLGTLGGHSRARVVQRRLLCTYPGAASQRYHTDFESETWTSGCGSSLFVGLMPTTLNVNGEVVSYDYGDVVLIDGNVVHAGTSLPPSSTPNVRLFCYVDAAETNTYFVEDAKVVEDEVEADVDEEE